MLLVATTVHEVEHEYSLKHTSTYVLHSLLQLAHFRILTSIPSEYSSYFDTTGSLGHCLGIPYRLLGGFLFD
jgi:hypothetical protein